MRSRFKRVKLEQAMTLPCLFLVNVSSLSASQRASRRDLREGGGAASPEEPSRG